MRAPRAVLLACALSAGLGACRTAQPIDNSDAGIKARIEANLSAERELDLRYVTLDVHSRIVTVSGIVNSWHDKRLVSRIVQSTKGVDQALINLLTRD